MNKIMDQEAQNAIRRWNIQKECNVLDKADQAHACFCIGPQNGEPYCPCRMRHRQRERDQMRREILEELRAKRKTKR